MSLTKLRPTPALMLWLFSPALWAAEPPRQTVENMTNTLIEVMKDAKTLGYQGRYKKLDPVVTATHDFQTIAQIALGDQWKKLSDPQRKQFVDKLTEHSVATYAVQFDGYSGEQFVYKSERMLRRTQDYILLRYDFVIPGEPKVQFDFLLGLEQGKWKIVNIIVDGVSDLALRKAQYNSIIQREGFPALLTKLQDKINDYAAHKKPTSKDSAVFKTNKPGAQTPAE